MIDTDVLIIGAGITGISFASFMENDNYLILEKESEVGGYCKTTITDNFVWDYSGHFFHFNNKEIKDYVLEHIDCEVVKVNKKSHIYYKDRYVDFPFQNNIHQLPNNEFIECLYDLYNITDKHITSFTDYVKNKLGNAICDKFIIPYNQKLYACDLNTLDYDAMGRFFPKPTNFDDLLNELRFKTKSKSYNDTFIYPTGGSIEFVKSLLKRVNSDNIKLNTEVINIDLENKIVKTNRGDIKFNKLINTLPFDVLLKMTGDEVDNLSSNKVVVFNLGFDKPTDIKSNWVYYPSDEIFYRVGFYNNIFNTDKMSLYVEIGLEKNAKINESELLNKVLNDLTKVGVISEQKLIEKEMIIMNPAYVHITEKSKKQYQEWSEKHNKKDMYSIGRYGSWTYCSIEDNITQSRETHSLLFK